MCVSHFTMKSPFRYYPLFPLLLWHLQLRFQMSLTCSNIIEERLWWQSIKQEWRLWYLGCRGRYWGTYKKRWIIIRFCCHRMKGNYSSNSTAQISIHTISIYEALHIAIYVMPLLSFYSTRSGSSWASRHSNTVISCILFSPEMLCSQHRMGKYLSPTV